MTGRPATLRLIGLAFAALIFLVDQAVKDHLIRVVNLKESGVIEILPFFDLRWVENYGVSLGLLTADSTEMRWFLVAMTAAIALFVAVWMMREKAMADIAALAMILGGALGNIHDRYRLGFVVDYADLHFGEFRPFLVFNIADAAITIGVLIILARSLLSREKPRSAANPAPEA